MQILLKETGKHYRDAKEYQIAREQTRTSTGELTREWTKDYSSVASGPGNRYAREDKNDYLWRFSKSDGVNQWIWEPWTNQYAQRLVKNEDSQQKNPAASGWVAWLMNIDKNLAEGRFDGLETVEIAGRQSRCMVIIGPPGRGRPDPGRLIRTRYWIDRDRKILVKEELEDRSLLKLRKFESVMTTAYTKVELGEVVPDSVFKFVPPENAERIARFDTEPLELIGKPAPSLKLKTLDGRDFDLASLKGKPVIIDFWATWCGPCRESMPMLADLHKNLQQKGLVIVSVSKDDEPSDAAEFVAKHHYEWIQVADPAWKTDGDWGSTGVPRLILVSPNGIVSFVSEGFDKAEERKLRSELHRLDPEFPEP